MVAYYIDPAVWEDEKFNELSLLGRCVWLYLLTGRCRSIFPGLIVTQPQIIAVRLPPASIESVEDEFSALIQLNMIQFDRPRSVVRIVNAAKYARCMNPSILRCWYRLWRDLPRSPLKYTHLDDLYEHCISREAPSVKAEWEKLFAPELRSRSRDSVPPPGTVSRTVSDTVPHTVSSTVSPTVSGTVPPSEREIERDIDMERDRDRHRVGHRANGTRSNVSLAQRSSSDPEQIEDPRFRPGMTYGEWQAILKSDGKADPCKH